MPNQSEYTTAPQPESWRARAWARWNTWRGSLSDAERTVVDESWDLRTMVILPDRPGDSPRLAFKQIDLHELFALLQLGVSSADAELAALRWKVVTCPVLSPVNIIFGENYLKDEQARRRRGRIGHSGVHRHRRRAMPREEVGPKA